MKDTSILLMVTLCFGASFCDDVPCAARQMEFGPVCVCNSSYCDTVERPPPLAKGRYYRYTTTSDQPGFHRTTGYFKDGYPEVNNNSLVFTVDPNIQYQEILGFGGSFSDAAGIVVNSLPFEVQKKFFESYFGINGLEYSMARVPIGMSDFSTREYFYDDVPDDEEMVNFTLAEEDYKYKIPMIQRAMSVSPHKMKLIGCAFSSPRWMKTSNSLLAAYIKQDQLHAWAKYHVKFLDAYAENGIPFWAITGGNEVFLFLIVGELLPLGTMAMPHDHIRWLRDHLAPQLAASNHSDVKFLIMDDMKMFSKFWMSRFALDPPTFDRVEGVALHWYMDWFTNVSVSDDVHHAFPDKLIMYTESSVNTILFGGQPVELGAWNRGALYAYNIIENLNHWTSGYLDWNLALDQEGGPSLMMKIDSPVIVNATGQEFFKNPMFYTIGHFSKFILPGSRRVDVKSTQQMPSEVIRKDIMKDTMSRLLQRRSFVNHIPREKDGSSTTTPPPTTVLPFPFPVVVPKTVSCVATVNPDNSTTVIVFNGMDSDVNVTIVDTVCGYITATLAANSLNTFVYWLKANAFN